MSKKQMKDCVDIPRPPEGIAPYYIEDSCRMSELAQAIARNIVYANDYNTPKAEKVRTYEHVAKWAYELKLKAEVNVKLIEEEKR